MARSEAQTTARAAQAGADAAEAATEAQRRFDVFEHGIELANAWRYEDALRVYAEVESLDPDFENLAYNQSVALGEMGRWQEALDHLDVAIPATPDFGLARGNRGWILLELNRAEEALASIEHALAINGTNATDLMNRGVVYLNTARYAEALADFDTYDVLSPGYASTRYYRGLCLEALDRTDEVLDAYREALSLNRRARRRPGVDPTVDRIGRSGRSRADLGRVHLAGITAHPNDM